MSEFDDWAARMRSRKAADRNQACEESSLFKEQAIPFLIAGLKDGDAAAYALARFGAAALPELLETFCTSRNKKARQRASWCLSKLGPSLKPAVPRLLEKLAAATGDDRDNTIFVLYRMNCSVPEAVPVLIGMLGDFDAAEPLANARRVILVNGLAVMGAGSSAVIDVMIRLLDNVKESNEVRGLAAKTLESALERPDVVAVLTRAQSSTDPGLLRVVEQALVKVKPTTLG